MKTSPGSRSALKFPSAPLRASIIDRTRIVLKAYEAEAMNVFTETPVK
jgi:hypothetical protein